MSETLIWKHLGRVFLFGYKLCRGTFNKRFCRCIAEKTTNFDFDEIVINSNTVLHYLLQFIYEWQRIIICWMWFTITIPYRYNKWFYCRKIYPHQIIIRYNKNFGMIDFYKNNIVYTYCEHWRESAKTVLWCSCVEESHPC